MHEESWGKWEFPYIPLKVANQFVEVEKMAKEKKIANSIKVSQES